REDSTGDKAIYAYYVLEDGVEMSVSDVREELSINLPDYMIPAYMMQIESIPVTKNGKLDKKALPEIEAKTEKEYIGPRNEVEEKICNAFAEILGIEKVGVRDGFFELGGHSLRATRLVNRIEEQTGKRIALKDIFSNQTPEKIAMLVNETVEEEYTPIPKAEEKEYYPMSSVQKRTYLIEQMDPDKILYNMPESIRFTGEVRPDALKDALQKLIDRHEILRTSFIMVDGEPVQKILPHVEADFEYINDETTPEKELLKSFIKPFDLSNPPLVRVRLVNRGEYHLLCMDMHHIVSDGMSSAIFTREFNALYNGEELEPLTHQFKDYSEWMRNRDLSNQAKYWKSQFDDEIPVLDMPLDFVRPQEQSFDGAMLGRGIGKHLTDKIKEVASVNGTTEYMIFMSAVMVLLSKYSRQEDIVIGTPISGRTHRDTEDMLGMFVNTLALRGKPEGKKSYKEFLSEIKEISLKAYENQEYPFEELVEAVDVKRDTSRSPIFDVLFVFQNNEEEEINIGATNVEEAFVENTIAKFDLSFYICEYNGEYGINVEYCTALYNEQSARNLVDHFVTVLEKLMADTDKKLSDVEVVSEEEKNIIFNEYNDTKVEYPREKTLVELFEEQVEKTPENVAVVFEDSKLTYCELNKKANALGNKLREAGVGADDFVAIISDRSLEMVEGIYGIIKSGGVYLPIDPTYPDDRINFMLDDANPKAVLIYTTEELSIISKGVKSININGREIPVIDLADGEVFKGVSENLDVVNKPEDLCYCIYTSGTTGKPKGVMIKQQNVVNYVYKSDKSIMAYAFDNGIKNFVSVTNYVFDIFVTETILTLCNGMTAFIANSEQVNDLNKFKKFVEENNIEILQTTPSRVKGFLAQDANTTAFENMKYIILGGEAVGESLIKHLSSRTNAVVENGYGPSEATVYTTCAKISEGDITIGRPVENTRVYIMQDMTLCGIGIPGELCVAGDGLARGYLNRPELTAEKFIDNPYGENKLYRTGDLARWLPDGRIEYLGRIDEQVKIRGFRVELGEIESRIREIEKIRDVAVIARTDVGGDKAIYAYYVVEDGEITVTEIRECLSKNLPDYMIPSYMMQIEKIPVTKNGKLDKRALPDIEVKTEKEYVAPRNEIEEKICNIFAEILGIEKVGINDGFFELGGHSLRATKLVNRIEEQTGRRIALKSVFSNQTPEKLAELVGEGKVEEYTPIPKAEEKEYYPMSSAQKRTYLLNQIDADGIAYNMPDSMKLMGEVRPDDLKNALQEIINRHEILRTSFVMV
ncbi:MAG TPA: non-ribosomal peptide synthetase, partial [Eubacterium sp.]|nr:non-ribosomal peptide synthetase [Eubacterium sp.]